MRKLIAAAVLLAVLSLPVAATATGRDWNVDPNHTEVKFSVTHFFTPVNGFFRDFDVSLNFDREHPDHSVVQAKIAVASVDTGNERRDTHLRSGDWFEADKYPYITFKSTSVQQVGENRLLARGDLTIKGVTRQVQLPIELLGVQPIPQQMKQMMGGIDELASFRAELTLNRNDFNVGVGSWAGTMIVGGEVHIELVVEANH